MGREIRKVPKGWEHPKNDDGKYIPLYNESFATAFSDWYNGLRRWLNGKSKDYDDRFYTRDARGYTEYAGQATDPEHYRVEDWTEEEATCYQIYQTVSEGTPVSPVFESLQQMEDYLVNEGYSRSAAKSFCESGYAPSFTFTSEHGIRDGISSYDE